jgi:hypothetical protein
MNAFTAAAKLQRASQTKPPGCGFLDTDDGKDGGSQLVFVLLSRWPVVERVTRTLLPGDIMLYTLAVVLLILWLLGVVSGYTISAFIHVLLVIALVLILVQFISGRRTVL